MEGLHKRPIDIRNRSQILSLVKSVNKDPFRVWQKSKKKRKFSFCKVKKINDLQGDILIESHDNSNIMDFNNDYIYFYSPIKSLIFKAKVKKLVSKRHLLISVPEMVKIEDARTEKRKNWGFRSYQFLDLSIVTTNLDKKQIEKTRILDSSENGVGIIIDINQAEHLKVGNKLITLTSSIEGIENRVGVIRSIVFQDNGLTGAKFVRVGIELLSMWE